VALNVGNPLFPTAPVGRVGVSIAFQTCVGDGVPASDIGPIDIGTLFLIFPPTPNDVRLRVENLEPPFGNMPRCPRMVLCDAPFYMEICVAGGQAFLNNSGPDCTVAATSTAWSRVRAMFRGSPENHGG
jgi:hypothetical protein